MAIVQGDFLNYAFKKLFGHIYYVNDGIKGFRFKHE